MDTKKKTPKNTQKKKPIRDTRTSPPAGITKGGRRYGCGGKVKLK